MTGDGIEGFSKEIQVQPPASSLGNSEDLAASWVFGTEGDGGRNALVVESQHGSRF